MQYTCTAFELIFVFNSLRKWGYGGWWVPLQNLDMPVQSKIKPASVQNTGKTTWL